MHQQKEKPLIRVDHIRKVYRMGQEKVVALDDVTVDIRKGEIVCFLGTSGSGKSTFLNMVAGLEKTQVTLFRQKNIGFIFQAYHLIPSMTALENVTIPLTFRGVDKSKRLPAGKAALKSVGLEGYENRKPSQMSGGQQQRVGIARALVGNPRILFADEPTGNLDSSTTREVMEIIVSQVRRHGMTLILVSHDRTIAEYADTILTIQDGNIVNREVRGRRDEEAQ